MKSVISSAVAPPGASLPARAADTVTSEPQSGFVRLNFNFAPAAKISAAAQGGVTEGLYAMGRRTHVLIGVVYLLLGGALVATSFGWNPFGLCDGMSSFASTTS